MSTRLRPWLDLHITPARLLLTDEGAQLAVECVLQNSGSVPARDVRIEATLINVREQQDEEFAAFFKRESARAAAAADVGPMSRTAVKSSVVMKREAIQAYGAEGRALFVPLLLFNVRYRWATGEGQSAACFLLGRGRGGQDKLAPFRLDRGRQDYRDLDFRRLSASVRR